MKNKDIKERIRQSALKEIPDIRHKIDIKSINIEPKENHKKLGYPFNMKLAFTSFLLLITGFLAFQILNISDSTYPLDSDIEVLGFETISAQAMLEYSNIEETDLNLKLNVDSQTNADDTEAYLNDMTPMIELAELIVNNKDRISYEELTSNLEDYQNRIHFRAYNLTGDTIEYNIYYNQYNGTIRGKIVNGDTDYEFIKSNETLRLNKNETDFVEVSNMQAKEVHEFVYRFVKNNIEQFSTNIRMEIQDNRYEASFNYQDNKGIRISLMMRRQDQNTIDVDYNIEDQAKQMNGRFNVDVQNKQDTGQMVYRFIFDDASTAEEEKPGRGPDDNPGNPPSQHPPGQKPVENPPGQNK
ncbi:MAG: hypothetical protein ACLFPM_06270 [Candidatus Izemoplasmatales bacterium]